MRDTMRCKRNLTRKCMYILQIRGQREPASFDTMFSNNPRMRLLSPFSGRVGKATHGPQDLQSQWKWICKGEKNLKKGLICLMWCSNEWLLGKYPRAASINCFLCCSATMAKRRGTMQLLFLVIEWKKRRARPALWYRFSTWNTRYWWHLSPPNTESVSRSFRIWNL